MLTMHWRTLSTVAALAAGVTVFSMTTAPEPAPVAALEEGTFSIDGTHSSVVFKIVHLGVSPFYGRFNTVSGEFELHEDMAESSVRVEIDAASVDSNNADRDKHIKSADFFNVEQFPAITFESKKVESKAEDQYAVTGDLEFHGVKKEVKIDLRFVGSGERGRFGYRAGFEGRMVIKRSDFGVKTMLEGLSDEVEVLLGIEGARK